MSVPLPPTYHYYYHADEDSQSDNGHEKEAVCSIPIDALYLTSDERFQIQRVKVAERPHLIHFDDNILYEDDDVTLSELPLIDGYDIPGWRREAIAVPRTVQITTRASLLSLWNIGASSTMFRRDRQWPVFPKPQLSQRSEREDNIDPTMKFDESKGKRLDLNFMPTRPHDPLQTTVGRMYETTLATLHSNNHSLSTKEARVVDYEEYSRYVSIELLNQYQSDGNDHITCPKQGERRLVTKFSFEFERNNVPAKILGITKSWNCMPQYPTTSLRVPHETKECCKRVPRSSHPSFFSSHGIGGWTFDNLLQRFGNVYWRFSDTHGEMITLETYAKYITNPEGLTDDSPLAIYDSEFGDDDSPTHELIHEYHVPQCFSTDLFNYANTLREDGSAYENRPPWRWILIGPKRSGTGLHIDPLWTNAWVTVLQGRKRWILFPPDTPKEMIGMIQGKPQIPSVIWFEQYYTKVIDSDWPEEYRPIEIFQEVGETVFVPNGWPHLVVNLELTVAVTHNYASEFGPFERMWKQVVQDEADFARCWYNGLRSVRPDLADRIYRYHHYASSSLNEEWAKDFLLS